ncbi:MAG: hypothetical protein JHD28_06600 [Bacteroidia bacterium]|nr:hypothetical protein [Bacteroidia bacterium]
MKVTFTIIFFLLLTICVSGQENGLRTKLIDKNFSWNTATAEQLDSFYFDLQSIQTTKFKAHFRISLTGQTIDFFSSDNVKFHGKLTNYITEYITVKSKESDYDQSKAYQYIIEVIDFEQSKVDIIVEKLIKTGQPEIPTDSLIASWQRNFLHCNSIVFQFNFKGKYTKQTFHCPWGQKDSVEYKNIVLENYQSLKSTFQLDSLYDSFEDKLPKGKTYSRDGYRMIYKWTDKQSENFAKTKPQRDFMKSVKDTVDNYINSELKKQKIELIGINCFQDYRLTFGKNGKLKLVKLSHYNKPTLKKSLGLSDYLADKKEIRKCKRKIKQIFNNIDLSFLNLQTEIYRTLSFGLDNEIQLRDNTIY